MSNKVRQMEDAIRSRFIITVGAIALSVFAIGIYWAARIQHRETGSLSNDTAPRPKLAGKREIGMVYQPMYTGALLADENREIDRARLDSYGWSDPSHQHVHIPIDRAIELYLSRGKL